MLSDILSSYEISSDENQWTMKKHYETLQVHYETCTVPIQYATFMYNLQLWRNLTLK